MNRTFKMYAVMNEQGEFLRFHPRDNEGASFSEIPHDTYWFMSEYNAKSALSQYAPAGKLVCVSFEA